MLRLRQRPLRVAERQVRRRGRLRQQKGREAVLRAHLHRRWRAQLRGHQVLGAGHPLQLRLPLRTSKVVVRRPPAVRGRSGRARRLPGAVQSLLLPRRRRRTAARGHLVRRQARLPGRQPPGRGGLPERAAASPGVLL